MRARAGGAAPRPLAPLPRTRCGSCAPRGAAEEMALLTELTFGAAVPSDPLEANEREGSGVVASEDDGPGDRRGDGEAVGGLYDVAAGPFSWELGPSPAVEDGGIELHLRRDPAQPAIRRGAIRDRAAYVGIGPGGAVRITRQSWYAPSLHLRALLASYPSYPQVALVDYPNLAVLAALGRRLPVGRDGRVPMAALLPLLDEPRALAGESVRGALLALLSGTAAGIEERAALGAALDLPGPVRQVLVSHGVLVGSRVGHFRDEDLEAIDRVLGALPAPLVDLVHRITCDEGLPPRQGGALGRGGEVRLAVHAGGRATAEPLRLCDGAVLRPLCAFDAQLAHQIAHRLDEASAARRRFDALHLGFERDPNGYLDPDARPHPGRAEDFAALLVAWLRDSRGLLEHVRRRRSPVLSARLSLVLDQLPHREPGRIDCYEADAAGHLQRVGDARTQRDHPRRPGEEGRLLGVDGIFF
jgi:hypothetical protein